MPDNCCHSKSSCMSVKIVKLSPFTFSQHVTLDAPSLFVTLILFEVVSFWLLSLPLFGFRRFIPDIYYSPPRQYLKKIRILII